MKQKPCCIFYSTQKRKRTLCALLCGGISMKRPLSPLSLKMKNLQNPLNPGLIVLLVKRH